MPSYGPHDPAQVDILINNLIDGRTTMEIVDDANGPAPRPDSVDVNRWADIIARVDYTPGQWRGIAAAVRNADNIMTDRKRAGDAITRGGPEWCQLAADTQRWLAANATVGDNVSTLDDRCLADPDAINAWLTTPGMYRDYPTLTMADVLDVDEHFNGKDDMPYGTLQDLVVNSQNSGVWGVPGHFTEMHRVIDHEDQFDGFLLVTRPQTEPPGPALASDLLQDHDLADTHLTGIDAATAILTNAAAAVNATLDARDRAAAPRRDPDLGPQLQHTDHFIPRADAEKVAATTPVAPRSSAHRAFGVPLSQSTPGPSASAPDRPLSPPHPRAR